MKKRLIQLLVLLIIVTASCSKEDDPVSYKCQFTFKGQTYQLNEGILCTDVTGITSLSASASDASWILLVSTEELISFSTLSGSNYSNENADVSYSGKTFTFDESLTGDAGDVETIKGSCTCPD
jgi:hypothetical protein